VSNANCLRLNEPAIAPPRQNVKGAADGNVDCARTPAEHGEGVMGGRSLS